jgi:translation initiation factor IF-2
MSEKINTQNNITERPPIIVIMGHIDHGKSTLLDYIRKSSIVDGEAGGITQKLTAYEVSHKTKDGKEKRITFLDTPGHEAFSEMRSRGANVADIAILIVSAEDGVKQQTKEALESIKKAGIPYIVAINKIDMPGADIEKTKQNLAENDIFIEGYGGDIPFVSISAKEGTGVDELLDVMLLVAEMEAFEGDLSLPAEGVVIESHLDSKKGVSATVVVKNGILSKGMFVVAEDSISPIRIFENFLGKKIDEASFSSPVKIIGWSKLPKVGSVFTSCKTKKEAEKISQKYSGLNKKEVVGKQTTDIENESVVIPLIIKTDVVGMLEAIEKEIGKIHHEKISLRIIHKGAGDITENDIKMASSAKGAIAIGFNVKANASARELAQRLGVTINIFDIIYEVTQWLESEVKKRAPKVLIEEIVGRAKILKVFSKTKNKQVVGGKVLEGSLKTKAKVKIIRRENEIGKGEILGLQQQKASAEKVDEGNEFGTIIESTTEISAGDIVEAFVTIEK